MQNDWTRTEQELKNLHSKIILAVFTLTFLLCLFFYGFMNTE